MTDEKQAKQPVSHGASQGGQIQIRDTLPGAEYANVMQVQHNREEFLLTFMNIAGPSGRVVGKIQVNPGHLKRIVGALNDNIKKYETNFGTIAPAESPREEIGFRTGE